MVPISSSEAAGGVGVNVCGVVLARANKCVPHVDIRLVICGVVTGPRFNQLRRRGPVCVVL